MVDEELKVDGNGHNPIEDETPEQLEAVRIKLSSISRGNGQLTTLTKQEVGLLHKMLNPPDKGDDFIRICQICDFLDDEEANRELEAYYEAVRLGMDTNYNIAHALSRVAINRKGSNKSNRVAALLDALSHQKYTSNQPRSKDGNSNPSSRSPIA